jgi:hypothetical protein
VQAEGVDVRDFVVTPMLHNVCLNKGQWAREPAQEGNTMPQWLAALKSGNNKKVGGELAGGKPARQRPLLAAAPCL